MEERAVARRRWFGRLLPSRRDWIFLAACALAGSLSVPPDQLSTSLAALSAGLMSLFGLRVWAWSRLPSLLQHDAVPGGRRVLRPLFCFALGLLVGLGLLAVIRLFIEPRLPSIGLRIEAAGALPIWRRAVIIYVAAVTEELIFRLFLFSLIAGLAMRLWRPTTPVPTAPIVWGANVLSALAFGAVHLPGWSSVTPPSDALVLSVLALNGIAGLVVGYVFATRGIVPAMWTHAGGDCAIQFLGPFTG